MNFFSGLFHEPKVESAVLVDITSDSVAGAYVLRTPDELPLLLYAKRLDIKKHAGEDDESAMLRALAFLSGDLVGSGAPALARVTGNGAADYILVSVDAPWQETSVRTERIDKDNEFTFTRALVKEALQKACATSEDKTICNESVVGTMLNGYATRDPYGKKVHRAEIIILSSIIRTTAVESITNAFRGAYHTNKIELTAGSALRYQALRSAFPHEHNALILDATGSLISIELIRNDLLVSVSQLPDSKIGTAKWATEVREGLASIAEHYPLPRSIFLLARDGETENLQNALETAKLGSLWLSDNPPKVITVLASHLTSHVRQTDSGTGDLPLILMALYAHYRRTPSLL